MSARRQTVLVVEDNTAILSLIASAFEGDCSVFTASSGDEAILLAADRQGEFDVAVCDINLAGWSGPSLIERIAPTQPGMRTVFISGGRPSADIDAENPDVTFLAKPFRPSELRAAVRRMTDGSTD